jgi:hypothetical protein
MAIVILPTRHFGSGAHLAQGSREEEAKCRSLYKLDADLVAVVMTLAADGPLQHRHRDHELTGNRDERIPGSHGFLNSA